MKKLLAALLACMTITCAFVSCGDSNESSKESKKSSSSSEKDDDKDDDEDDDEDESSEEEDEDSKEEKKSSKKDKDDESSEESEDESSEEEKKSDKKSKKKSDGGSATSEDIAGDWYSEEIGGCFSFHEDGNFSIKIDISDMMTIDEKGVAHMVGEDEDYSDYCTYDGETLEYFGMDSEEDAAFEYEIDGDELKLTSEGETLVLERQ